MKRKIILILLCVLCVSAVNFPARALQKTLAPGEPPIPLGTTSQYWRGDKTWQTYAGMTYPGAGVANSTGSAWGTSYTVGTAANNLVQLNGSGQLPAVSGANLTNLPGNLPSGASWQSPSTLTLGTPTVGYGAVLFPTVENLAPFGLVQTSGSYTGGGHTYPDDEFGWGFNPSAISSAAQLIFSLESDYWAYNGSGWYHNMEFNMAYNSASDTYSCRPIEFSVDRDNGPYGSGHMNWLFGIGTGSGGPNYFEISDGTNALFNLTGGEASGGNQLTLYSGISLIWGGDTALFRSASNTLKTNGNLIVGGTLYGNTLSGSSSIGAPVQTVGSGLSDLTSAGTYIGNPGGTTIVYYFQISSTGTPDQFEWKRGSGGSWSSATNITGAAQTVEYGLTIKFNATTGHTLNNQWTVTVAITQPLSVARADGSSFLTIGEDGTVNVGNAGSYPYLSIPPQGSAIYANGPAGSNAIGSINGGNFIEMEGGTSNNVSYVYSNQEIVFVPNTFTSLVLDTNGNAGIGTWGRSFGTSAASVFGMGPGTPPSTASNIAQMWAANLNGSSTLGWRFMNQASTTVFTLTGISATQAASTGAGSILMASATSGPTANAGWLTMLGPLGTVVYVPYWTTATP